MRRFTLHIILPALALLVVLSLPSVASARPHTGSRHMHTHARPPHIPARCHPDPASAIAALPPGGVFDGSGCYVTNGILITKPVTINGGTYHDPVNQNTGRGTVLPIIRVKNTDDVTIENVSLDGTNRKGNYHESLVGQAGLDILSSSHITLLNVTTKNTYGDGATLFSQFGADSSPVTNLYVDGLTIKNAGRQAVTMGYVKDSTLNNVNLVSSAQSGWDFESDLPKVGSGNVTINNSKDLKGVHIIEALQGPITFNNCVSEQHVHLIGAAAASGQTVTFNGGSIELARNTATGDNVAGIVVAGPGRMVINHVNVTRTSGSEKPKGPAVSVTGGGHLIVIDSPLPPPVI